MVSSGPDGISFQEHDGPGTAAMIDRLIWIWAQGSPNGDVGLRGRLALRHSGCKGFRCLTASSGDVDVYEMAPGRRRSGSSPRTGGWRRQAMDVTEAQAVNTLLRWLLRLARPDGSPSPMSASASRRSA